MLSRLPPFLVPARLNWARQLIYGHTMLSCRRMRKQREIVAEVIAGEVGLLEELEGDWQADVSVGYLSGVKISQS